MNFPTGGEIFHCPKGCNCPAGYRKIFRKYYTKPDGERVYPVNAECFVFCVKED